MPKIPGSLGCKHPASVPRLFLFSNDLQVAVQSLNIIQKQISGNLTCDTDVLKSLVVVRSEPPPWQPPNQSSIVTMAKTLKTPDSEFRPKVIANISKILI